MAGYVAMARVEHGRVRALPMDAAWRAPCGLDTADWAETRATIDDPEPSPFAERLERIREQLAMTTFFLFDANSWR